LNIELNFLLPMAIMEILPELKKEGKLSKASGLTQFA